MSVNECIAHQTYLRVSCSLLYCTLGVSTHCAWLLGCYHSFQVYMYEVVLVSKKMMCKITE